MIKLALSSSAAAERGELVVDPRRDDGADAPGHQAVALVLKV